MPQYCLDTTLALEQFATCDLFTQGYIEAAFWLGDEDSGIPHMGLHDLAPEAFAAMVADCAAFQVLAKDDLEKAYDYATVDYEAHRAGVDFWLTRNGHGAGFWDRGLGDLRSETVGGRLSRDAETFGECDLYVGDDGRIYVS